MKTKMTHVHHNYVPIMVNCLGFRRINLETGENVSSIPGPARLTLIL